ncbi:unnamed protein product [Rotaria sp. Silwood2]|nr:unnamed protein product [Rotaria sp. Silwood2]CAF2846979.1 unnamed protein product [Rotaria sp. Silwood2]CAF3132550.1 unnamed protein product [Rotaria sp. Silwood2]CAF3223837.1 unnamed protein product [Rotaria sp. Silwood2]CAF3959034.1 unnamed protein product [Rotaria sp. Silwood2]
MSSSSGNQQEQKIPTVNLSDAEWKKKLSDEEYRILRKKETEYSGTGKYNKHFETGIYKCAGCGQELYESSSKFDSHCGWPAFSSSLATSVRRQKDEDGYREEILCAKCDGHLVGETGQIVERVDAKNSKKVVEKSEETERKPTFSERTKKRRRREWDAMNYEPFDITRGRDYERSLQRISTRGIVQLFNTVRKQQQNSSSSTTTKKKKENTINKGEFLDMLKTIDSDEVSCKIMKKNQLTTESTTKTTPVRWNVLQDDLMASIKDEDDDDDDDDD